jgi:hypothetical protein
MHQQLWVYKVEDNYIWGYVNKKRLNNIDLEFGVISLTFRRSCLLLQGRNLSRKAANVAVRTLLKMTCVHKQGLEDIRGLGSCCEVQDLFAFS